MARVVGLTGGIGSGKSTVARLLAKLGAAVIDADAIVRELQAPGSPLLDEIARAFGPAVIRPEGGLDREALGEIVFRDPEARARLNAIVHPPVAAEMARRTAEALRAGAPLVVLDVPLLLENATTSAEAARRFGLDAVVVVYAPPDVQVERQIEREGYARSEAWRRVCAQRPLAEKRELADYVIDNSGPLEATEAQVRDLFARLTREAAP